MNFPEARNRPFLSRFKIAELNMEEEFERFQTSFKGAFFEVYKNVNNKSLECFMKCHELKENNPNNSILIGESNRFKFFLSEIKF